jgi:tetratricopeptide (TPR) repeat protein
LSAFQFKGDDIDIPTVADQLGVRHILEGSVRKSGNSVRITAQLIEAKTDRHLWSQTYDRTLEDTFAVQDEVSAAIASAIGEALGFAYAEESSVRASIDPEAYNQYLLGVYNVERRTKDSVEAAIRDFERSIEIEPDYADAHARLAVAHLLLGFVADLNRNEQFEKAKPHAEKAYSLSPNSWEANMAMGRMLSARGALFGTDYDEAVPYMEKTLELNPSYGPAYAWMAELQSARGDYVGRHKILEAGIKVAPLDNALLYDIAHSYIYQDRFDEAQKIIDRLTTITPSWALNATATLATRQGRWADNAVALIHYLSLEPTRSNYWARRIVSEDLGLPEEALTIGDSDDRNLRVYVVLGRESEALERARSRYEEDPTLGNLWGLGDIQAYVGKLEAANSTFEEQMSQSENVDLYEPTTTWIAAKVAVGNMEDARELVRQLDERIEQRRRGGIDVAPDYLGLGYAHYLIGNRERGLAELERTVRLGFYVPTFQAYLEELRNDPEFAPLLAAQRQKQKEQQEIFLTIMCGPDNPIPDFWKPSDAACDSLSEQAID